LINELLKIAPVYIIQQIYIYFLFDELFSEFTNLRCLFRIEIKYIELIEAGYTQTSVFANAITNY